MSKHVSMQNIADRLGISKYTVSQALSGKDGVSDETRLKIMETARTMGYRKKINKSPAAAGLFQEWDGRRKEITSSSTDPYMLVWIHSAKQQDPFFWPKVIDGLAQTCRDLQAHYMLISVPPHREDELAMPGFLDPARCMGHILLGTFSTRAVISLQQTGLPLVLVDHEEPLVNVDCVVNSNVDAAVAATKQLLREGCDSLVFVGSDSFSVSFRERALGCRIASEEAAESGRPVCLSKWNVPYLSPTWPHDLAVRVGAVSTSELPDGFICANDHIALRLMALLKQRGFDIPGQCRVIGFDNIEAAAASSPALSTVELSKELLGIRAVETLLYRKRHPGRAHEKIVLAPEFIARASG
ncbi:LacI family DNA-binding transcriptional regulator [Paenibacillus chitinolyticus]|uniref:LacI family DNA-binding transcriptional regulator n=1 Tax=Paenibacillus chitinolyticus TaxID=79263 RepID=UPI001C453F39|nr:LacI family DNA-binding transcriptional regulator [Paenibacillus chitinolyticus]MBV6713858.1 LacI family DNA-binding transcriptional regulator [Paenibacillus chitinolyticus]